MRGRGCGRRRLLAEAETWGLDCGCRNAWLMTMSFQARGFYERAGYVVFAELPESQDAKRRLFMRKSLTAASPDASNRPGSSMEFTRGGES